MFCQTTNINKLSVHYQLHVSTVSLPPYNYSQQNAYCALPLQLLLPPLLQDKDPNNRHICSKSMERICNCTSMIYITTALYKICCIIMHDFLQYIIDR